MRVDIAWWNLDGTSQTIDSLREHLRDGAAEAWATVPGLRLKYWMADREHNRWGAVMLWESAERPEAHLLPPNRAAELIGCAPHQRERFEIEAAIEGRHSLAALHRLGPALMPNRPPALSLEQ